MNSFSFSRASGVLLHISSLPGPFGCGDFGDNAYLWIDSLAKAKQKYWQILPLNPIDTATQSSPYSSPSAFAGNPLFISPIHLYKEGLLEKNPIFSDRTENNLKVHYHEALHTRMPLLYEAAQNFKIKGQHLHQAFHQFCELQSYWLDDYVLFIHKKEAHAYKPWWQWQKTEETIDIWDRQYIIQFLFYHQWQQLHAYAQSKGIAIIGDIPIYVSHDSADVWSHQSLFDLTKKGIPKHIAGVPPDYFSSTGQSWGNPLYLWKKEKKAVFNWWIKRIHYMLSLYDSIRIDHFRGFASYWVIPYSAHTAIHGKWKKGPGIPLFDAIKKAVPNASIFAEDLGTIDQDVKDLLCKSGAPGMNILQFAFGDDIGIHPYAPHNIEEYSIVYTGTHDNNTTNGWFTSELSKQQQTLIRKYCLCDFDDKDAHKHINRLALSCKAKLAILPLQDILGLYSDARMNTPGTSEGNWQWRAQSSDINYDALKDLHELTVLFGR
jgi:4-alpha-glucanotransferase